MFPRTATTGAVPIETAPGMLLLMPLLWLWFWCYCAAAFFPPTAEAATAAPASFVSVRPDVGAATAGSTVTKTVPARSPGRLFAVGDPSDRSASPGRGGGGGGGDPAKRAALEGVLQNIERTYGRGSILKLGDADGMGVDCIGTGALTLDAALGGGYPRGRVVEIYGPESSGKTTLALHAIAEVQKMGGGGDGDSAGTAAFVDAEHALDPSYAAALGVNVDELFVSQPDSGEMALDIVDQLVRSSAVDLVVVDSVAALVPRAELEGDMSDTQIGLQARLMSKAMRKIVGSLAASRCTVMFLNQLRSKVGVIYGSPEVTSGGNALKFYSSVRLDTRRREILPENSGIKIRVKVVKNKVAAPFRTVDLDILFRSGLDKLGCALDAALELGIAERRGSWYAYRGTNFAQGRYNAVERMRADAELSDGILADVRRALVDGGEAAHNDVEDDDEEEIGGYMDPAPVVEETLD